MSEEQLETLAGIIESCMNYAEYGTKSTNPGFANSLPASMRIDALSNGLAEARAALLHFYIDLGGEDVWESHPGAVS